MNTGIKLWAQLSRTCLASCHVRRIHQDANQVRKTLERLGVHLNITKNEDWYNVQRKQIPTLEPLLKAQYNNSFMRLVTSTFPDHPWEIWRFELPNGFWTNISNQKTYIDWLAKKLQFSKMEDWYKVTADDFIKNDGKTLLNHFQGSPSKLVTSIFSEHKWEIWKFGNVPKNFWDDKTNKRKYMEWLGGVLGFKSMTEWCIIITGHFEQNGGRGLLDKNNGSPGAVVMACFPEYAWLEWKFSFRKKEVPKKELIDFVRKFEQEHNLSPDNLDDWYGYTLSEIKDTTTLEFIKRQGGLHGILSVVFPDHNWEAKKFDHKDKKTMQSWVKSVVQKLLPNSDVIEEYKHTNITYPNTNKPVELDVFVPQVKLAFEFQGQQHFHTVKIAGSVPAQQHRDDTRKKICEEHNITLIDVPYWWDKKTNSIEESIVKARPDIVFKKRSKGKVKNDV